MSVVSWCATHYSIPDSNRAQYIKARVDITVMAAKVCVFPLSTHTFFATHVRNPKTKAIANATVGNMRLESMAGDKPTIIKYLSDKIYNANITQYCSKNKYTTSYDVVMRLIKES